MKWNEIASDRLYADSGGNGRYIIVARPGAKVLLKLNGDVLGRFDTIAEAQARAEHGQQVAEATARELDEYFERTEDDVVGERARCCGCCCPAVRQAGGEAAERARWNGTGKAEQTLTAKRRQVFTRTNGRRAGGEGGGGINQVGRAVLRDDVRLVE